MKEYTDTPEGMERAEREHIEAERDAAREAGEREQLEAESLAASPAPDAPPQEDTISRVLSEMERSASQAGLGEAMSVALHSWVRQLEAAIGAIKAASLSPTSDDLAESFRKGFAAGQKDVKAASPSQDAEIRALVAKWRDPEFWKGDGSRMDSIDAAAELEAVLASSSPASEGEQ